MWHVIKCCCGELDPFCDQYWLQALWVLVHLIDLLSTLLSCNGFAGIHKAAVDQASSRPPNSDRDLFLGASLTLGSALELLLHSTTELVIPSCCIKSTFSLYVTIWSRNGLLLHTIKDDTSKRFEFQSAHKAPTHQAFSPFQFASNVEWQWNGQHRVLSNFSCSCKRISFRACSQLATINFLSSATMLPHLQGSRRLCKTSWTTTAL